MFKDSRQEVSLTKFPMKYGAVEHERDKLARSQSQVEPSASKIFARKKEALPPISSPFLKKTVQHLFFDKNVHSVIRLQQLEQRNQSSLDNKNQPAISKTNIFLDQNEDKSRQQITKSFSQMKHRYDRKNINLDQLKKSQGVRPNVQDKKPRRNTTEVSDQSNPQTKGILKKIRKIRQMQKPISNASKEKLDKIKVKQVRQTNFVMKQKIHQELYVNEKQQIKMVKSLMKNSKEKTLTNFIKVKNYSKFMPGIIFIEN